MGKMKDLLIDIQEMIKAGEYPVNIVKRTGCTMEMVLQAEEDLYEMNNPRNYGPDYDQE